MLQNCSFLIIIICVLKAIINCVSDQEKMLKDNVERMYRETDPWR